MSIFRVLLSLMSPNKEYANGDKYDGWWYNGSSAGGLLVFKHEGTPCYHILADVEGVPNLFVLIIASCSSSTGGEVSVVAWASTSLQMVRNIREPGITANTNLGRSYHLPDSPDFFFSFLFFLLPLSLSQLVSRWKL